MTGKVRQLALKELKESLQDSYFYILTFVVFLLFVASLVLNSLTFHRQDQTRREAQAAVRAQWLSQGETNPHGAAHFGITAFKAYSPLAILDRGLSDYTGQAVVLETHKRNAAVYMPAKDQNAVLRFGYFTPAFILQYFFPLIIIILSYAAITAEKENNTLRLLLSHALSGKQILAGKILGILYKLLIIYIPVVVLMLCFIAVPHALSWDHLLSLGTVCLLYFLYFLIFALLSVSISCYCGTSRASLLGSLSVWMLICIFIPRITNFVSTAVVQAPSTYDYSREVESRYKYDFSTVYNNIEQTLVKEQGVTTAEDLNVNPFGYALDETELMGQQIYEQVYGHIETKFHQQNRVAQIPGLLSPLQSLRTLSMDLCRTGFEEHLHFGTEVEQYRRDMMHTLNMDIAHHSPYEKHDFVKKKVTYKQDHSLWEQVPAYQHTFRSITAVLKTQVFTLFILAGWVVAAFALATYSYQKIKI